MSPKIEQERRKAAEMARAISCVHEVINDIRLR